MTSGPRTGPTYEEGATTVTDILDELQWRGLVAQSTVRCSKMRVGSSQFSGA